MRQVRIGTSDGEVHFADGWASDVQKKVNEARGTGEGMLIPLPDTNTPSQTFYIDPNEVTSIKDW